MDTRYAFSIIILSFFLLSNTLTGQQQKIIWEGFNDANQRIEKIRKGELTVKVINSKGKPAKGATVEMTMVKNEFDFGCAINALKGFNEEGPNPEMEMYLNLFKENFQTAVIENGMKWRVMETEEGELRPDRLKKTNQCITWLNENNIPVRGHNVIWPSWENMPKYLKDHEPYPKEIKEIVEKHFKEALTLYQGQVFEWDLVNEPAHHRDLLNIFGEEMLTNWYHMAKKYDTVPMFINQWYALNGTYHPEYKRLIQNLKINKAPLGGIGLQGHLNVEHFTEEGELDAIWEKLNQYAEFDLPIKITELDINGDKGEGVQARALENALTMFYSHPSVQGVMIWGFWEGRHWRSNEGAALWRMDGTPKQAGEVWKKLVNETWTSHVKATTNKKGLIQTKVYSGKYKILVKHKGQEKTVQAIVSNKGNEISVVLGQ